MLFNLLTLIPLLAALNLSELKTVSDGDMKFVEVVESVDDEKLLNDEIEFDNFDIALPTKSVSYVYSNNDYIGYNYYSFNVSNGDIFTLLCNGFSFSRVAFNNNQGCFAFLFSAVNKTVYIEKNGSILSAQLPTNGTYFFANFSDFSYTDSSLVFTLVDSGVVTESSGGDDSLPDDPDVPDSPIVSGGDYTDILTSIDEKLSYFQGLFYYGDNLDSMGDGFKILIILTFLVAINLVIKIINWR